MKEELHNEFIQIIENSITVLTENPHTLQDALKTGSRLEKDFEHHVLLTLSSNSQNGNFKFSAMTSLHAFPDIIAESKKGNICYGVEVKTAKTWKTTGNSIMASITDEKIKDIYIIFCKKSVPPEFSYKRYEDAIKGISVTHSPRYILDMKRNTTGIFEDLKISYEDFKNMPTKQKITTIRGWYIANKKATGKWWIY